MCPAVSGSWVSPFLTLLQTHLGLSISQVFLVLSFHILQKKIPEDFLPIHPRIQYPLPFLSGIKCSGSTNWTLNQPRTHHSRASDWERRFRDHILLGLVHSKREHKGSKRVQKLPCMFSQTKYSGPNQGVLWRMRCWRILSGPVVLKGLWGWGWGGDGVWMSAKVMARRKRKKSFIMVNRLCW